MKKLTALGIKEDQKPFRITQQKVFKDSLDSLPKGRYTVTIAKYYKKSSPEQFGWLYACIYPMSLLALNDAGYEFTDIDQIDVFWKMLFANKDVLNRETGEIIKIPLSKSEFKTIDQMVYCNSIRDYCSEFLGVVIPDPNPYWNKKE